MQHDPRSQLRIAVANAYVRGYLSLQGTGILTVTRTKSCRVRASGSMETASTSPSSETPSPIRLTLCLLRRWFAKRLASMSPGSSSDNKVTSLGTGKVRSDGLPSQIFRGYDGDRSVQTVIGSDGFVVSQVNANLTCAARKNYSPY